MEIRNTLEMLPGTYTHLNDCSIPALHVELALGDVIPWHPGFVYFVDNDGGEADTLQNLIHFLEHR